MTEQAELELLRGLVRRAFPKPNLYSTVDDDPPRLNGVALDRLRALGNYAVVNGERLDITKAEYDVIVALREAAGGWVRGA